MTAQVIDVPRVAVVTSPKRRIRHVAVWGGAYPIIGPLCRNFGYTDSWPYFPAQAEDYPSELAWCTRCKAEASAIFAAVVLDV